MSRRKLTSQQIDFLADWCHLVQKWNLPNVAKNFGVTPQALQYHVDKLKEKNETENG